MNEDEILILLFLHVNPGVTTTTIAKDLFSDKISCPEINDHKKRKYQETVNLRNEDRRVRYYLERFVGDDLVTVELINRKQHFSLNSEKVHLGLGTLTLISLDDDELDEFSMVLGRVLVCKMADGLEIEPIPEEGQLLGGKIPPNKVLL